MFVNRIKICPDLHKLQLWFSRLRQCLFLKLLHQWTHKTFRYRSAVHVLSSTYISVLIPFILLRQIQILNRTTCLNFTIIYCTGGDWGETGGPLNFLKPERGGLWKNTERWKKGGFENIYQFEKTLVVLKMYHKTT
jgi:hypothetical protein